MKKLFVLFCLLVSEIAFSQTANEELAAQFLANKEFEKAADMYEKLLSANPRSMYYYDNLLKSYIGLTDFQKAQKLAKKQAKRYEGNYFYLVDEGYVLKLEGAEPKAKTLFENLINKLPAEEQRVYDLAKAFEKRKEGEAAIETYLKGRKLLRADLLFAGELAGLYQDAGDKKNMTDEYLNLIILDASLIPEVQGQLQNILSTAADYEYLKTALQKKQKQYPERSSIPEMLIWMHVQRGEFDNAALYAKMLDRKNKEEGRRMLELGLLAISNEKYDAAISILKQVQALGSDKPYYIYSKNSEVEARTKKLLNGSYTQADLLSIEAEYKALIAELGENTATASTIKSLANLQAFYMQQYDAAIKSYETVIQMPRADRYLVAQSKLELGDLYLLKGEVWESLLLYGQVDKDFLEEPIGQEAKFRNARLSYFMGEFDWAKAQLDILKTATTQLIANNAIELSLLIQDNTIDSTQLEPLKLFASADLNFLQNNLSQAKLLLDSIERTYPKHDLSDDILYKKAEIATKQKDFNLAAQFYEKVYQNFGDDILGDNALFNLAKLQQFQLNNKDAALKSYELFIDKYPGSFFLNDCRKQYRLLRGDQIN